MIVTHLLGGLGNQMFQYAAGLALANYHRTILKLDPSWFRVGQAGNSNYALSCFNITEQFATADECAALKGTQLTRTERWSAFAAKTLRLYQYSTRLRARGTYFSESTYHFDPAFWSQPDGTYLEGLWQSEKYFAPVADLLRAHFSLRYPPNAVASDLLQRIRASESCAIHVRRGDYVSWDWARQNLGICPREYYLQAADHLSTARPDVAFYIFSDEPERVRRELGSELPGEVVDIAGPFSAYEDLRLMSACSHQIISNSTFSWWAAWLNPHPTKLIIAPARWRSDDCDTRDVVPDTWISMWPESGAPIAERLVSR